MKTKIKQWLRTYLLVLTEVPGWPDAPVSARARRALPVVIPCVAMVLLLAWNVAIHAPRVRAQQASLQPLVALESSVATQRLAFSAQQVGEIAERAAGASRLLLDSSGDVPDFLRALKQEAAGRGWDASFFASDPSDVTPPEGMLITHLPVRGKLTPLKTNSDAFTSLLGLLERISSSGKRIDLVRLAIRADERRWHLVEMNFHLVCAMTNEKTP